MGLRPLQVEPLLEVTNHDHPERGLMLADLMGRIASPRSRLVSMKVGYLKGVSRGWRDGPMVKSIYYSWRGSRFGSQHPHGSSQLIVTPTARVSNALFRPPQASAHVRCTYKHSQLRPH